MRLALGLLVGCLVACGSKDSASPPPAPPPPPGDASLGDAAETAAKLVPASEPARRMWTPAIADAATFEAYSEELGGERFAKFVVDLKSDAIYYFDVNVYKVHKDFVFSELYKKPRTKAAVRAFDKNYGKAKPEFLLCYLVHHLSADVWTFAFWDGDKATAAHVTRAYNKMKATFFLGDKVKFRPDSDYQEAIAKELTDVPVVLNDQLYRAADYVAFNQGSTIGWLRLVPPGVPESELTFEPNEIVVLHAPLADITPVAGIISEQFSTPLSHVSLRARAWGIPNIGLRDAAAKLEEWNGKQVYFAAKGGGYELREPTAEEVAAVAQANTKTIEIPEADLTITSLASLDQMRAADITAYGAKATALGEIVGAELEGVSVPPGFSIPFHYYAKHLEAAGVDKLLAAFIADPPKDAAARKAKLAEIRKAILDAPIADELRTEVERCLVQLPDSENGVFVRSSHNAEDLPDFNGAGLYDTVPNVRGNDAVLTAIKRVWSSVWNYAAYEDRRRAGIDQTRVFGSAFVQVGVRATAAGVLLTEHPTDPKDIKNYTINAKSGLGMSVVDGRKVPESLIVSWYNHGIRVLSRSAEETKLVFDEQGGVREVPNPDAGKPVLSNAMALRLADTAKKLTKVFHRDRIDIEWVFAGDELYIVQTRPLVR
ncbi:MAG: pyruvate, phosphate dikinase [Kofleriaceae bacterium]|nr:pyruvate, phosphate dikinase [Kofleriaceae bacterium]